jgi:5'-nucleotidase
VNNELNFRMKRRRFIKNSSVIAAASLTLPSVVLKERNQRVKCITILHTNDTHSNIDPFPENHAKYPGMGGVEKRFELIQQIRSEQEHVILLDAGDIFQGTPYFNKYGGILEMKLMTALGYDVGTMGNHDFDGGLEGFAKARTYADFPFVCGNYDFKNTPVDGLTAPTTLIEKGGLKIGVFGVGVELQGLVPDSKFGETKYLSPIEVAQDCVRELQEKNCDLIICLSHLGYSYETDKISDLKLAQETKGIHLIIGGHTHTFLEEPTEVLNLDGEITLVNQVGWAGINLGRIDFEIEKKSFARKDLMIVQ